MTYEEKREAYHRTMFVELEKKAEQFLDKYGTNSKKLDKKMRKIERALDYHVFCLKRSSSFRSSIRRKISEN